MNQTTETPIDHDALFKELLHQLLEPFLRLFFPQYAGKLDFRTMRSLEQEFFTDFPSGKHRYIDTLVEIFTLSGELILVHVEFQSTHKSDFPKRMFRYFTP
jgi:predicted transposase/invertase (TIGR01784 family)